MLLSALWHALLREQIKDFPTQLQPLGRRAPRPAVFGARIPIGRSVSGARRSLWPLSRAQGHRDTGMLEPWKKPMPRAGTGPPPRPGGRAGFPRLGDCSRLGAVAAAESSEGGGRILPVSPVFQPGSPVPRALRAGER